MDFVVAQATATWGPNPSGSHIFGVRHRTVIKADPGNRADKTNDLQAGFTL